VGVVSTWNYFRGGGEYFKLYFRGGSGQLELFPCW
jgi:hypothetical protein